MQRRFLDPAFQPSHIHIVLDRPAREIWEYKRTFDKIAEKTRGVSETQTGPRAIHLNPSSSE
jgi:hypothetical protein